MDYIEKLELGDGESAELLQRLPWERALAVRSAAANYKDEPTFVDAICRAHLWRATLKDYLTGESIGADAYGRADPRKVDLIAAQAFALYIAWSAEAYPKAQAATAPTTGETATSDASPPSAA